MSQCDVIVNHLRRGKSITTMQAYKLYGITTLSQRIGEIKRTRLKEGEDIYSIREYDGDRHHTYFLRRTKNV